MPSLKKYVKNKRNSILSSFIKFSPYILSFATLVVSCVMLYTAVQTLNESKKQREMYKEYQNVEKSEEMASFIFDYAIELINLNECIAIINDQTKKCIGKDRNMYTVDDNCLILPYFERLITNEVIKKIMIRYPGKFDSMHKDVRWIYRRVKEIKDTVNDINALMLKNFCEELTYDNTIKLVSQHIHTIEMICQLLTPHVNSCISKLSESCLIDNIDPKEHKISVRSIAY